MGVRTPDGLHASKLNILQEGLGKQFFLVICRAAHALRPSRQICDFPLETQEKNKIISIVTRAFLIWYVLRFFSRRPVVYRIFTCLFKEGFIEININS